MNVCRTISILIIFLFTTITTNAQPNYESSLSGVGVGNSITMNKPSGTSQNDLLVVGITFEKGTDVTITKPTDWTLIRRVDEGTNFGMAVYYKIVSGTEPSNYTFTLTNGPKWSYGISRISNVNTAAPLDAVNSVSSNISGKDVTAPSLNASVHNRLILCFYTNKKDAVYTPAPNTTVRYDAPNLSGGLPSNMMATFVQNGSATSGDKVARASIEETWAGIQIAFGSTPITPLPVSLSAFNVKPCSNASVCLTWQTASESNNNYFTIERSINGQHWEAIINKKGAGNSNQKINYEATDPSPDFGLNYYRLKQTDFDGKFTYSPIQAVTLDRPERKLIRVYPNPVTDLAILEASPDELREVKVFNLVHKDVTNQVKITNNLTNQFAINLSDLPSGIYYVQTKNSKNKIYKL